MTVDYEAELSAAVLGVDDAEGACPAEVANLRAIHDVDGLAVACRLLVITGDDAKDVIEDVMKRYLGHYEDLEDFARKKLADQLDEATRNLPYYLAWSEFVDFIAVGNELDDNDHIEAIWDEVGVHVLEGT